MANGAESTTKAAAERQAALARCQLLDARETAALLAISEATLWRGVKAQRLPQPMRLGPRLVRWRLRDIEDFVGANGGP